MVSQYAVGFFKQALRQFKHPILHSRWVYIVIQKILNSKFVISSALSGVIVAEAFGIPARLLQIQNKLNTEDLFKYTDYYHGTNRFEFKYATSIEEALQMGGEPLPICDLQQLRNAFPFEYFNK